MPFTFSHPAAILPLQRILGERASASALAIGSMAPDLVYFYPTEITGHQTHSLPGLFLYCLPAGLFLYVLFHALLKQPLAALLPRAIAQRLPAPAGARAPLPLARLPLLLLSLFLGAATHLIWDSFTHLNTPVVHNIEFLRTTLLVLGGVELRPYKILQHLSSIAGLLILAIVLLRWQRRTPVLDTAVDHPSLRVRVGILSSMAGLGLCAGLADWLAAPQGSFERALHVFVVGSMSGAGCAVLLYCALWNLWAPLAKKA